MLMNKRYQEHKISEVHITFQDTVLSRYIAAFFSDATVTS